MKTEMRSSPWCYYQTEEDVTEEQIQSLLRSHDPNYVLIRSITPTALVSGFAGKDLSMLPNLLGKTVVFRHDLYSLGLPRPIREELESILRGVYDGEVRKVYGNGVIRHYEGTFRLIVVGYGSNPFPGLGLRLPTWKLTSEGEVLPIL